MAYDLTIHEKSLRKTGLRSQDFVRYPIIQNPIFLQAVLNRATIIAQSGFPKVDFTHSKISGKLAHNIKNLEDELVLRMVSKNISRLTRVRQSNRLSIIKCIRSLLEEGVDYRVYKLDVKSFYENVPVSDILKKLQKDAAFSRQSMSLLFSFFDHLGKSGVAGLPRGIALSATLAEYVMREFDRYVRSHPEVFFYSRFVDDMVLITSDEEDQSVLERQLAEKLPEALRFNSQKTRILTFDEKLTKTPNSQTFDFLGYNIKVYERTKKPKPIIRNVDIDISIGKINKIKSRIVKSSLKYCKDNDFDALVDRIKLLSGNYSVYDHARGVKRKAGIYYSYKLVVPENSASLAELDSFLARFFLSSNGRICAKLHAKLSNTQRRRILQLSFKRGFENRIFHNFSGKRLSELMKCWNYG